MSIEIYIQYHINGDEQFIENSEILAAIKKRKSISSTNSYSVEFDDKNSIEVFFGDDSTKSSSLVVSRPCDHGDFHLFLYELMQLGNCILFVPDGKFPIILNQKTKDHLPEGMIEGLGKPKVASDYSKFCALLIKVFE